MRMNVRNIFVIAQKEFADIIWSPRFLVIMAVFMTAVLSGGYSAGQSMARMSGDFVGMGIILSPLMMGFQSFSYHIGSIGALVAIVISYDAIVRERKSGSLNVLLTHPVYRDNVITGKLLGMMSALSLVIVTGVAVPVGIMLMVSGISVNPEEFTRIIVYALVVFLFFMTYLALGVAFSTYAREPSTSLVNSIAVWLVFSSLLATIAFILAGAITGQSLYSIQGPDDPGSQNFFGIVQKITQLSPFTHFQELIMGSSPGTFTNEGGLTSMRGLFDMSHTLGYWVSQCWINLVGLIVSPLILLAISFISFLRQDITV